MIPRRWMAVIPTDVRDKWAKRIVEKFKETNPDLYAAMGEWRSLPDDEQAEVEKKVLSAADAVHREVREEIKNASE